MLESAEIDFLTSYYFQDGDNAAVCGGIGTEKLQDVTGALVVSIPLNDDDVLAIDAGVSAYTSASSSNVNPFDKGSANPYVASSGASSSDLWTNITVSYSHSSDDRNKIWSAKASVAFEFDYFSTGLGGGFTRLFNEKNTEFSAHANLFVDFWSLITPVELRSPGSGGGDDEENFDINNYTITGNSDYRPSFVPLKNNRRNSYSAGLGLSQVISKNLQGSLALDVVFQEGLLSTPFQRVYFSDVPDSYIGEFHLADDVERLPGTRLKLAAGIRLNYYINEYLVARTYYRYYTDDWRIRSHTASIELPVKISGKFTLYPSFRYYNQTAAEYFAPYDQHLSGESFYTSDYDLSEYSARQYGLGISYTDIFTTFHIYKFGLKSVDLKYSHYTRYLNFQSGMLTGGVKFTMD